MAKILTQRKVTLVDAIDQSCSEMAKKNGHLSDVRSQLEMMKIKVRAFIKKIYPSITDLDTMSLKKRKRT